MHIEGCHWCLSVTTLGHKKTSSFVRNSSSVVRKSIPFFQQTEFYTVESEFLRTCTLPTSIHTYDKSLHIQANYTCRMVPSEYNYPHELRYLTLLANYNRSTSAYSPECTVYRLLIMYGLAWSSAQTTLRSSCSLIQPRHQHYLETWQSK